MPLQEHEYQANLTAEHIEEIAKKNDQYNNSFITDPVPPNLAKDEHRCEFCEFCISNKRQIEVHKANFHSDVLTAGMDPAKARTRSQKRKASVQCKPTCMYCNLEFISAEELVSHLETDHAWKDKKTIKSSPRCATCLRYFIDEERLANHTCLIREFNSLQCGACGEIMPKHNHIYKHYREKHVELMLSFQCYYCSEQFKTIYQRNDHLVTEHNIEEAAIDCIEEEENVAEENNENNDTDTD